MGFIDYLPLNLAIGMKSAPVYPDAAVKLDDVEKSLNIYLHALMRSCEQKVVAVEKRRGLGMYVMVGAAQKLKSNENDQFINEDWPKILTKIKHLNVDTNQLINSLKEIGSKQ